MAAKCEACGGTGMVTKRNLKRNLESQIEQHSCEACGGCGLSSGTVNPGTRGGDLPASDEAFLFDGAGLDDQPGALPL